MNPVLSPDEIERYARHVVMPEIGGAGQQKLKAAHVLMVGAGGLGAPALQYLAAAGIGHLSIVDDDTVSLSNLQRQVLHDADNLGRAKVESAALAIKRLNPNCRVSPVLERLENSNANTLIEDKTVVLDGSDNFDTRFLVADVCEELKVPLISAAVNRFDGSLTTLVPWEGSNPGYRDLYDQPPADAVQPTCAEVGVMGALTGAMGALQALEAIKLITGAGECLIGRLFMMETLTMRTSTIAYKRRNR